MTMDITSRRADLKTDIQVTNNTDDQIAAAAAATKTVKRPFDVAFLMLPDDKLKQKQSKSEQLLHQNNPPPNNNNNNNEKSEAAEEADFRSKSHELQKLKNHARSLQNALGKQQVFGDPNLTKPKIGFLHVESESFLNKLNPHLHPEQKSAFTKVNLISKEARESRNLSASPDVNYQNSLSPSPPIAPRNFHQPLHPNMLSPNQIFKAQNLPAAYQNSFIQENLNGFAAPAPMPIENPFMAKAHPVSAAAADLLQPNFAKMRPMIGQYRQELSYNYAQFQPPDMLKIGQPDLKFPPDIRNPAAALLSTLLPPSLAALSLPAQNICAKCNISFRMTSDLVYHMRSHHKNDAIDVTRKRREEKLKCPVCAESFRERHHLTRHMTAHQDKEEDGIEPASKKKEFTNYNK